MDSVKKVIRRAYHAGSWYSGDQKQLNADLQRFLEEASVTMPQGGHLRAIIGPHAGYRFSGPTAAWAYKNIDANLYKRVVILGPSHKVGFDFVATSGATEWETPIGNLPVDTDSIKHLEEQHSSMFSPIDLNYEENEHSLEMHAPFIRKAFEGHPELKVVPLMVGHVPREKLPEYGKALAPLWQDEHTLFVVSSDFCHWGKRFNYTNIVDKEAGTISKSIEKLDREGMACVESQKLEKFQEYLDRTKNTICGRMPIQILMATIEQASKSSSQYETQFIRYAQSGEIIQDMDDSSVSYASSYTLLRNAA